MPVFGVEISAFGSLLLFYLLTSLISIDGLRSFAGILGASYAVPQCT